MSDPRLNLDEDCGRFLCNDGWFISQIDLTTNVTSDAVSIGDVARKPRWATRHGVLCPLLSLPVVTCGPQSRVNQCPGSTHAGVTGGAALVGKIETKP